MLDPAMMGAGPPPMGGPPPPMGPPAMGPPPTGDQGAAPDAADLLRQILDLADEYRQQEDSDQNLLLVEQLRTIAQKILANEEKQHDDALQGKLSPSAIRKYAS